MIPGHLTCFAGLEREYDIVQAVTANELPLINIGILLYLNPYILGGSINWAVNNGNNLNSLLTKVKDIWNQHKTSIKLFIERIHGVTSDNWIEVHIDRAMKYSGLSK